MADSAAKPRWYRLTPDRLVVLLLVVEGLLWIFGCFQWLPKGYAVLLAVATVGVVLFAMLLWSVVALVFRSRYQFTIRTLLAATVAVALACSWFASERQNARTQSDTATTIMAAGGGLLYDYQLDEAGKEIPSATPPGWERLPFFCPDDMFRSIDVVGLQQPNDEALELVKGLRQLRKLSLTGSRVTDSSLRNLTGLTHLRWLCLKDTAITDDGLEFLRAMAHLEGLDLSDTRITNDGLKHLKVLARLRSVQLDRTLVTGDGAVELRQALPGIKIGGADAHVHNALNGSTFANRRVTAAIAELTEALKFDPDNASVHQYRGSAWNEVQHYDEALADYSEAIRLGSASADIYNERGDVWMNKGNDEQALADYDEAIRLDQNGAQAYLNRAILWQVKGKYSKALTNASQAITLAPSSPVPYIHRGRIWCLIGDYDKAIADEDKAIEIADQEGEPELYQSVVSLAYLNRAIARERKGDYDNALLDYSNTLILEPDCPFAYINRGSLWVRKKQYAKAVRDYRAALRRNPKDSQAVNALAWLQATCPDEQYRNGKKAVENALQAFQLSSKNCDIADTLAAAYAECGDFAKAREWETKAISFAADEKKKVEFQSHLELYKRGKPYRTEGKPP